MSKSFSVRVQRTRHLIERNGFTFVAKNGAEARQMALSMARKAGYWVKHTETAPTLQILDVKEHGK